jgi:uncharacterized protein (TIGR03435 family)
VRSDRYTINAKAEDTSTLYMMRGPMLQAILEDRFKLKIHRDTREVSVYAMTIAKGGHRLQPFKEGTCTPIDFGTARGDRSAAAPGEKVCPAFGRTNGPNQTVEAEGISLDAFAAFYLSPALGRRVINRTGLEGLFDFHLEYANPTLAVGAPEPSDQPIGASIFTVIEQLGLKLEPTKDRADVFIIDSVERPTEN